MNVKRRCNGINSDIGDLLIRGFWDRRTDFIIDSRICDAEPTANLNRKSAEDEKQKKHLKPCLETEKDFTPICLFGNLLEK